MSDEKGERISLTVADWSSDEGYVRTVFMEVGKSTHKLVLLKPGDSIPVVVGSLGQVNHIEKFGTVVCVGMVDGTGMCGVCKVSVAGETKFACADGPEFDGHEVDWELLRTRRQAYMGPKTNAAEL